MATNGLVYRVFDGCPIRVRPEDHYWDATMMCQATGKRWHNYWQNQHTREFLAELGAVAGIPATGLVQVNQGGRPHEQGTWVHSRVAMHLAQWCSAAFAVAVSGWVLELLTTGRVDRRPADRPPPGCEWVDVVNTLAHNQSEVAAEVVRAGRQLDGLTALVNTLGTGMASVMSTLVRLEAAGVDRPPAAAGEPVVLRSDRKSVRAAIESELRADPARTDALIASVLEAVHRLTTDRTTVGHRRKELEEAGAIPPTPRRMRQDGRWLTVVSTAPHFPFQAHTGNPRVN